jgi:hypothetical protein
MLREIRGVDQRNRQRRKRWFQDEYFDLFLWQDGAGAILEFQLCYRRDMRDERVLEWRRGRGFQHLKPEGLNAASPFLEDDTWALRLDGAMPYATLTEKFDAAAHGLPAEIARFVREKIDEYARPSRKLSPWTARVPRWLERLRARRRRILDSEGGGG